MKKLSSQSHAAFDAAYSGVGRVHKPEEPMSFIPKILIVDDDDLLAEVLESMLLRQGYEVANGKSGFEALELMSTNTFDLVLLDVGLPGMNGFETMSQIFRHHPSTMVIMMTGDATIESAVGALKSGAYSYLRKPFQLEEIRRTIKNAIDHKRLDDERKRSQLALKESEQRFRDLVENSLMGITIVQDNKIVYQNPEQKTLLGDIPVELDAGILDYVHPEDKKKVSEAFNRLASGKARSEETDLRFYRSKNIESSADMRWVQCRASMFKYQGADAILVNMTDLTRTKELEHLIIIKNKMLSLGRVAAGIAHEIRNPLTGINSYLYTMEDLVDSEEFEDEDIEMMQQIVGQMQVASNKIESVIKRVLDFSRPGAPEMTQIDINEPVKDALSLSAVSMRKSEIKVDTMLALDLPHCFADGPLIEQVILNLVNNAAKAMENNGGNKVLRIATDHKENSLFIIVSDSGPGVPLGERDKIFDPFFTTRNSGSGIGLSIAQRIIADHNGSIAVGSSKWGGAEFKIELPIERRLSRS